MVFIFTLNLVCRTTTDVNLKRMGFVLRSIRGFLIVLVVSTTAATADNCQFEPGGIGGTGHTNEDGGIGGTGHEDDAGGIGGTGLQDEGSGIGGTGHGSGDGGIGGTGDLADGDTIGLLGTISEFASICVNGVEVHFDPGTPVQVDGKRASHKALAIGQVVQVIAKNIGSRVVAQNIRVDHALSGPISSVNLAERRIQVLGQTVRFGSRSIVADGNILPIDPATLVKGQFVKISGLRRPNGAVMASRVERTTPSKDVRISGRVSFREGAIVKVDDGTPINLRGLAAVSRVRKDNVVSVRGVLEQGQINARVVDVESPIPFGGKVSRVNIEGYLDQGSEGRNLRLGLTDLSISDKARIIGGDRSTIKTGRRVRVSGRLTTKGRIEVDGITIERGFDETLTFPGSNSSGSRNIDSSGSEKSSSGERSGRSDRSERSQRSDRSDRSDRGDRVDRPNRPDRPARPERPERATRPDRPERIDRPDRSGRN